MFPLLAGAAAAANVGGTAGVSSLLAGAGATAAKTVGSAALFTGLMMGLEGLGGDAQPAKRGNRPLSAEDQDELLATLVQKPSGKPLADADALRAYEQYAHQALGQLVAARNQQEFASLQAVGDYIAATVEDEDDRMLRLLRTGV